MATIQWPAWLPSAPLLGHLEQLPTLTLSTQMDTGAAKKRRRFTAGAAPMDVPLRLTDAQKETLKAFWRDDLEGGALAFDFTHPTTKATVEMRFRGDDPPAFTLEQPTRWRTVLQLEVMP